MDLYIAADFSPANNWMIQTAGHMFRTAQDYASELDPMVGARNLGMEFDATLSTSLVENAQLALGGALFLPSEDWRGESPDMESWGFAQVTVTLD